MREVNLHISKKAEWLELSVDNTPQANLRIGTISGLPYFVDWYNDGNIEVYTSLQTVTKVYSTNYTGIVRIATPMGLGDVGRVESTGSTAWNFDLSVFSPLTGLTYFRLYNLPNANIDGSLNSFSGANGLTHFQLYNLPNANITGSINSFLGASGLTTFEITVLPNANITGSINSFLGASGLIDFKLNTLPNANITGGSSAFSNNTNLRDFLITVSPTSNIVMNYDDILNIWQSSVYIVHANSGISASKATTSPFNFVSLNSLALFFRNIGLSTASMDNMIIALDSSLVVQSSPKNIYLDQNAPHSGSPAVMTALSGLASKNITVVL